MASSRRIATATVVSAALCVAQSALGADSGTFKSVSLLVTNYSTMDHAGGIAVAGPSTGINLILESSDDLFPVGASDQLDCVVLGLSSAAGTDVDAYCTIRNSDGDSLYLLAKRRADDGGKGAVEFLGGTGKLARLTGSCSYTVARVSDNRQVSRADCAWQRPGE